VGRIGLVQRYHVSTSLAHRESMSAASAPARAGKQTVLAASLVLPYRVLPFRAHSL
jgi:hypothetical protein